MGGRAEQSVEQKTGFFRAAIEQCNLPAVEDYLRDVQAGQLINAQDSKTRETPLHDAIRRAVNTLDCWDERFAMVREIINHPDVDLTKKDSRGQTVLDFAIDHRTVLDNDDSRDITSGISTKRSRELQRRGHAITQLLIAKNLRLNIANVKVSGQLKSGLQLIDAGLNGVTKAVAARAKYYQDKGDLNGLAAMLQLSENIHILTLVALSNHPKMTAEFKRFALTNFLATLNHKKAYVPSTSQTYKLVISFIFVLAAGAFLAGFNITPDFFAVSWAGGEKEIANGVGAIALVLSAASTYNNAGPLSFFQLRWGVNKLHKGCLAVHDIGEGMTGPAINETKLPDPDDTIGYTPATPSTP